MSVFTRVTRPELDRFFTQYRLGQVLACDGIENGIENTNYRITTTQNRFILTLFESLTEEVLPHFLNLLAYLSENGLSCPRPLPDKQENVLHRLNGKPAVLFEHLAGSSLLFPTILQCREIGLQLAKLHCCTRRYLFPVKNPNGLNWCHSALHRLDAILPASDLALIEDELKFQTGNHTDELPKGVIHADLFKDNVLFDGQRISGLLDFYSACTDTLLLDLAITVNDWCCNARGEIDSEKSDALLAAYQSLRPMTAAEKRLWPAMLRTAALRFWLSRLEYRYFPRPGVLIQQKDPTVFRTILLQHREQSYVSGNTLFNFRSPV